MIPSCMTETTCSMELFTMSSLLVSKQRYEVEVGHLTSSWPFFFFKVCLFIWKELQRRVQMPHPQGQQSNWSWDPGAASGSPTWMQLVKDPGVLLSYFPRLIGRNLYPKQSIQNSNAIPRRCLHCRQPFCPLCCSTATLALKFVYFVGDGDLSIHSDCFFLHTPSGFLPSVWFCVPFYPFFPLRS